MIKIGLCGSMVVNDLTFGGAEVAPLLKNLGYDYIELSLSHLAELNTLDFKVLTKNLSTIRIRCECCNNFFPPKLRLTGPDVNSSLVLLHAEKALKRASLLGATIVVFGSGAAKNVPPDFSKEQAWEQLVLLCRELDLIADKLGITIVLEPLRKAECNIVNTVAEALQLINDSNTQNIKVLVDYYHLNEEKESSDILFEAKSELRHVHFANPSGRIFPKLWNENKGYHKFFENLRKINYNGRISIEAYSDNFYEDAKASINFMNQIKQRWN